MRPSRFVFLGFLFVGMSACGHGPGKTDSEVTPVHLVHLGFVDATGENQTPLRLEDKVVQALLEKGFKKIGLTDAPSLDPHEPWARYRMALRQGGLPVWPAYWSVKADLWLMYGLNTEKGLSTAQVPGDLKVVWAAELKVRPPGDDLDLHAQVDARGEVRFEGKGGFDEQLRRLVERVHGQLVDKIQARIGILTQPESELARSLRSEESEVRLAAVERLSITHSKAMGELLVKQLGIEKDNLVRLRVIGALAERKEKSAVEPLIALVDPRDREVLRAILDALVAIGGKRVDDFLDILSSHDAADIRLMVEYARQRLGTSRDGIKQPAVPRSEP